MRKIIYKIRRSLSKVLPRVITDLIKLLLRCLLEGVQAVEFIA